ncbi:uncharacterized protein PAC_08679 [Phialocephala subalpina]|uniref:Uncharacterized protein n=1 Tax=Phialocephala subalpina TaxID=576137 RepID=A0A1L7X189_9HELO|nr:uncharacterized protein PAC_08679 [Phialocephala subalpina]
MVKPKTPKSSMTEEDRLRRDEDLMIRLRIYHEPETTSETWPSHLKNTFGSIDTLGSFRYQSYDYEAPAQQTTTTWRREIKLRAKQLSDTAQRLFKENPSELTWRLEIEKLVDARFRLRTECKTCSGPGRSGRLWRSEVEVVTEGNGRIAEELMARRKTRVPCQCLEVTYSGLNPLFSNRADQEFSYDPHFGEDLRKGGSKKEFPTRRPDRLYGLRQTLNFEARLGSPAKHVLAGTAADAVAALMQTIDSNCDPLLVQHFIQTTPFLQRGDPLLFPFLILEAKSEEGRGHRNCGVQTSLPIWALLKAQERLSELSCPLKELGGPLVWYISYLGDSWHVSACCTVIERGEKKYQIRDLWNGRISSPDGALQVLLIMDYIFDWARDIYRPSILHCLGVMSHGLNDTMSLTAESDLNSMRKHGRGDDMTDVESTLDIEAFEASASGESLLDAWKKYDLKALHGVMSYNWRAFRSSSIIKSSFQCLYLTRDNIGNVISCLATSRSKLEKIPRDALAALRRGPMIITDRILSQMENTWTGENRESRRAGAGTSDQLFCGIVHAVTISTETWELVRTIFCIAVDHDALQDIRKHAQLSKKAYRLDGMEEKAVLVDENTVTNILQHLKNRGSEDNLAFAMANVCDVWKPVHMLNEEEREQLSHGAEQPIILQPLVFGSNPMKNVVQGIYKRHKPGGRLEPDTPCLRFSAQIEQLETRHLADHPRSLPLDARIPLPTIPANSAILVCDRNRGHKQLCIYITKEYGDPPPWSDLTSKIASVIYEERYFILERMAWNRERGFSICQPTVQSGDELIPLIKTAAQSWAEDLYKKFDKDCQREDIPEVFKYDKNAIYKLYNAERDDHRPFSDDPIRRHSNKKRRLTSNSSQASHQLSHKSTRTLPGALAESRDSEVQVLLEKWGAEGLLKSVHSVLREAGHGTELAGDAGEGNFESPIDLSSDADE